MEPKKRYLAGFGGGCHWCTEAVFRSVKGVLEVRQGWIASVFPNETFSEAVIVSYHPDVVTLKKLCRIHLHTHSSTSKHSKRKKYRSAVYYFDTEDATLLKEIISDLQIEFNRPIITEMLPFSDFKESSGAYQDYYAKNPEKPFCKVYIEPKLKRIKKFED